MRSDEESDAETEVSNDPPRMQLARDRAPKRYAGVKMGSPKRLLSVDVDGFLYRYFACSCVECQQTNLARIQLGFQTCVVVFVVVVFWWLLLFFFFFACCCCWFFACFTVSSIAGIRSSALTLSAKNLSSEAPMKRCGSITSFECHISVT